MRYGYARVSTKGQARDGNSLEAQVKLLTDNGAEVIYQEAYTGTTTDRPEFDKLCDKLVSGDTLIVTKLDRFARSVTQGIEMVDKLLNSGIKIHILNMGVMDSTPTGKLIRTIMLAFAEFERDLIVERTTEGKAIKKARGELVEGRPKAIKDETLDEFNELLLKTQSGEMSVSSACRVLNISRGTWYNQLKLL